MIFYVIKCVITLRFLRQKIVPQQLKMTAEQRQYFKKKVFIINEVSDERPAWKSWIFFFF